MGQSAGAACAHLLSLSKATDGLFRRVILSSGTANPGFYTSSPLYAQAVAALFLAALGVNSTDPTEIHKQLVNIPLQQILLANSNVQYRTGIISFAPVVESRFPGVTRILDDEPTELIKRGRGKHYPMLVGVNTLECGYFDPRLRYLDFKGRVEANPTLLLNPEIVFRTPPDLTQRLARVAIRRYFKARFTYDEYARSCSETLFVYPAFELANLRAATKGAPVFLYQFAYQSQLNYVQESGWLKQSETVHIEDFVKIFKPNAFSSVVGAELPAEDKRMKDWMTNIVVNFIRCSTPTCTRKTERSPWPAVQQGKYNYQRIEKPGVFLNRGPTPEQWHMIEYFKYLEAESKRAAAALVPAAPSDAAINNVIAQFTMARPRYPLAVRYTTPRKLPRFKHINSVQT
nr:putative antennal esterase CXE15 [Ectropis grisescens]